MRVTTTFTVDVDTAKAQEFFDTEGLTASEARDVMRNRFHDMALDEVEGFLEDNDMLGRHL